jgi:cellobiose phosphorylase
MIIRRLCAVTPGFVADGGANFRFAGADRQKTVGVFIRRSDQLPEEERILLHAVARLVIVSRTRFARRSTVRRPDRRTFAAEFSAACCLRRLNADLPLEIPKLSFFNGVGGFSHGGREYVATLGEGQWDARTVVQRDRQSPGFWLSGDGNGWGLYVVSE